MSQIQAKVCPAKCVRVKTWRRNACWPEVLLPFICATEVFDTCFWHFSRVQETRWNERSNICWRSDDWTGSWKGKRGRNLAFNTPFCHYYLFLWSHAMGFSFASVMECCQQDVPILLGSTPNVNWKIHIPHPRLHGVSQMFNSRRKSS